MRKQTKNNETEKTKIKRNVSYWKMNVKNWIAGVFYAEPTPRDEGEIEEHKTLKDNSDKENRVLISNQYLRGNCRMNLRTFWSQKKLAFEY